MRTAGAATPGLQGLRPQRLARLLALALALGLLATLWPSAAAAGRIEGRIRFAGGNAPSQAAISPYAGRLGSSTDAVDEGTASAVQELAVYLKGAGPAAGPANEDPPELEQRALRFHPRVLAVPVGTTVAFPNLDPVFHNVFSYSPTKRFDLGRYGKGESKSVTFDQPGLVEVFCDVHSSMQAWVLIVESTLVTQPAADGSFAIDGVPEGRHTLVVWHPELGEQEFTVVVGDTPVRVDLSF